MLTDRLFGQRPQVLPLVYVSQKPFSNLCWAACGEMLFRFTGRPQRMCQFASWRTGGNCCSDFGRACDRTCWPHEAYRAFDFDFVALGRPVRAEGIAHEIGNGRPVQMILRYSGWRHTSLIYGITPQGDYLVHDPLWGEQMRCTGQLLLQAYGTGGEWEASYHGLGA